MTTIVRPPLAVMASVAATTRIAIANMFKWRRAIHFSARMCALICQRRNLGVMTMSRMKTLLAAALLFGAVAHADPAANKQLVLDAANLLFVQHQVDQAVDKYFAPSYIQHNPMVPNGSEPMRKFFKGFYAGNPQATIVVKRALADGDLVAVHYNMKIKPEDRGFAVVDIFRVENGKIAEHWDVVQPVAEKPVNDNTQF
jgi:predicted SnoaL-like aldol condensation-catalyzing enzyme